MNVARLTILTAILTFALAGVSAAQVIQFEDSSVFWRFDSGAYPSRDWRQNTEDVNGVPDILGGTITANHHNISSIDIYYTANNKDVTSRRSSYKRTWEHALDMGDIFIDADVDTSPGWDYVITHNAVFALDREIGYTENGIYYTTSDWGVWDYRAGAPRLDHPVYASDGLLWWAATWIGSVQYSGWDTTLDESFMDQDAASVSWTFDNDLILSGDILIGLATNCANDVLLEKIHLPTPEPSTFLLLLVGIAGVGGVAAMRKRRTA